MESRDATTATRRASIIWPSTCRVATAARDRIVHGSLVVLVDGEGRIAEKRTDLELDPDRLLASLRKLLG